MLHAEAGARRAGAVRRVEARSSARLELGEAQIAARRGRRSCFAETRSARRRPTSVDRRRAAPSPSFERRLHRVGEPVAARSRLRSTRRSTTTSIVCLLLLVELDLLVEQSRISPSTRTRTKPVARGASLEHVLVLALAVRARSARAPSAVPAGQRRGSGRRSAATVCRSIAACRRSGQCGGRRARRAGAGSRRSR